LGGARADENIAVPGIRSTVPIRNRVRAVHLSMNRNPKPKVG
jgi:hypothetical protein